MTSKRLAALTLTAFMALSPAASADKGGGHNGDTSPGNSGQHKVVICHKRGLNPPITITVDEHSQLPAHLRHGDSRGPCPVVVVTPPPTDEPPVTPPTDEPPVVVTPPETPPTPATPTTPAPSYDVPTPAAPEQLVSPERLHGNKRAAPTHAQNVARVHRQQKALAKVTAQARAQTELPHTGLPAGLIAALGIAMIAGGEVIRRRISLD